MKYFTIEQANKSLTLLRPIVSDILSKIQSAQQLHAKVQKEKSNPDANETELLHQLRQAEDLLNQVEYHIKELDLIGVKLQDLQLGIVDFPCVREGRLIYLCWMPQETSVQFWHEINEGFSRRKYLDEKSALAATV